MSMQGQSVGWMSVAVMLVVAGAWASTSGCEEAARQLNQRCEAVEATYQRNLQEEMTELEEASDGGEQGEQEAPKAKFGLTLSNTLLSDIVNTVLHPVLKSALKVASSVRVAGQNIQLDSEGDILQLQFESAEACDHCFRVSGSLNGSITASIPSLGQRRANLAGGFSLVAPLVLEPGDEKAAAIKLDLDQLADIGSSNINARLTGISSEWANRLQGPVSRLLMSRLTDRLEPVTLVEFQGPSFGIDGFRLTPVQWQTDADHQSVFAGFSTNIAALQAPDVPGISPVTRLEEGQNIALSFQPKLVVHALSLLITGGDVSRNYTLGGEAAEDGALRVTLSDFLVGEEARAALDTNGNNGSGSRIEGESGDTGFMSDAGGDNNGPDLPMALGFQIYNFQQGGFCFSGGARAAGGVSVREGGLQVSLDDVDFTSSTLPRGLINIANWSSAQFVQRSRTLVETSLDRDSMSVPGSTLSLGPVAVELMPDTVVLRGQSAVQEEGGEAGSGE